MDTVDPVYVPFLIPAAIGSGAVVIAAFFMRKDFVWKDAALGLIYAACALGFHVQNVHRLQVLAYDLVAVLVAVAAMLPRPRLARDWYVDPNSGEHFRITNRHGGTIIAEQRTSRERFIEWHGRVKKYRVALAFFGLIGLADVFALSQDRGSILLTGITGLGAVAVPFIGLWYAGLLWNRTDYTPVWPEQPAPRTDTPTQQTQSRQQRRKKLS